MVSSVEKTAHHVERYLKAYYAAEEIASRRQAVLRSHNFPSWLAVYFRLYIASALTNGARAGYHAQRVNSRGFPLPISGSEHRWTPGMNVMYGIGRIVGLLALPQDLMSRRG